MIVHFSAFLQNLARKSRPLDQANDHGPVKDKELYDKSHISNRDEGSHDEGKALADKDPAESSLNRQADAARDRKDWEIAAKLYGQIVENDRTRDDIRVQAGNCLKEMGDCQSAYGFYKSVKEEAQIKEANLQIGHLCKISGNYEAAKRLFSWCAANGSAVAREELASMNGWRRRASLFAEAQDKNALTQHDQAAFLDRILAVEVFGLDCSILAQAAEALKIENFMIEADVLGTLAIIVAGPSIDRRPWLRAVFVESGLWPQHSTLVPAAKSDQVSPRQALLTLAKMPARETEELSSEDFVEHLPQQAAPPQLAVPITVGPSGDSSQSALLDRSLAALRSVVSLLFMEPSLQNGEQIIASISQARAACDAASPTVYTSFPTIAGVVSLRATARRICLNAMMAVCKRLDDTSRWHGPRAVHLFHVPTSGASAATCGPNDIVVFQLPDNAITLNEVLEKQLLEEALLLTGARTTLSRAEQRAAVLRLATSGRMAAIDRWFSCTVPSDKDIADVIMSASNQIKELGHWLQARHLALMALSAQPHKLEYVFEVGILSKTCGLFIDATERFLSVLHMSPTHADAAREFVSIARECFDKSKLAAVADRFPILRETMDARGFFDQAVDPFVAEAATSMGDDRWSSTLTQANSVNFGSERIDVHQIGWLKKIHGDGVLPRLIGIVSVRSRIVARHSITGVRLRIAGHTVDYTKPSLVANDNEGKFLYYSNNWVNTSILTQGITELQIYAEFSNATYSTFETKVYIDHLQSEEEYFESDAIVIPPQGLEGDQAYSIVKSLPSSVRSSSRRAFQDRIHRVLVMRLDQLGDVATSLPAIRRLKGCFPDSTFEALVTPANESLVRGTGMFDEITTVEFHYKHEKRRREISKAGINALRQRYANCRVDIAIDLSPSDDSRPILKYCNARYKIGFKPSRFDFLDFGIEVQTRDAVNRKEFISHTAMVNTLVEAIAAAVSHPPERFQPSSGSEHYLADLGLTSKAYIVIHAGARLAIKRWPLHNYVELVQKIRSKLKIPVAFFADENLPESTFLLLKQDQDLVLIQGGMNFPAFDAVISNAMIFIGNDTGPKHLAALRGIFTLSVHMGQVNWNEWGQDSEGCIVSRRIPCCGCGIEDPSECGKNLACLEHITPDELFDIVEKEFTSVAMTIQK